MPSWISGVLNDQLCRIASRKAVRSEFAPTSALVSKFVAGPTAAGGIQRARALLKNNGINGSLCYLGGYVDHLELVEETMTAKLQAAHKLANAGLDVHVSADPSQIGYRISPAVATANMSRISETIAVAAGNKPGVHALVLGMEGATLTDATLEMHRALVERHLPAAITLQAYLKRTEADLGPLIRMGAKVRLVKGAYAVDPGLAFLSRAHLTANWHRLIDRMLSKEARDNGFYPIIATHDGKARRRNK
jgi:proline dehydrogenase